MWSPNDKMWTPKWENRSPSFGSFTFKMIMMANSYSGDFRIQVCVKV